MQERNDQGKTMKDCCLSGHCLLSPQMHYETLPIQFIENFSAFKIENFVGKQFDIFKVFAQNIDCGYTLEPPRRGEL